MLDVKVTTVRYLDSEVYEGSLPFSAYENADVTLHENLEIHEAIDLIRNLGLRFDATGNEWAADPDRSRIVDFQTGMREQVTAHPVVETMHDWELAAIIAGVDGTCSRCGVGNHH